MNGYIGEVERSKSKTSMMKKCYFCKGKIVEKKIAHLHSWQNKLILFKQTPAEVCKQCGETYLKPEVIEAFRKKQTDYSGTSYAFSSIS